MVNLKPEVDRFIDGLDRLGMKKLLEHVTSLADSLSNLAITGNSALLDAVKILYEVCNDIRSAPAALTDSEVFHGFGGKMTQTLDHLDTLILALKNSVSDIQPVVLETIHTVRHAVWLFSAVNSFTQIGLFLNNLYSSTRERAFREKETQTKILESNLEYIRTFFGSGPEAIAATHILGVKATIYRLEHQGICPPGSNFKNIFVSGRQEIWHHVQAMRKIDQEIDDLFPNGLVYADSLQAGLTLAECYLSNKCWDSTEKHPPTFFGFHFVNHVDPIIPVSTTVNRHEAIHVGRELARNGFCIVGEGSHLGSRIALSVKSTITLPDGSKVPLCEHMNPRRLSNVLYHGSGYGKSLVNRIKCETTSIAFSVGNGITEAGLVKFGPYGLVKLVTGKCIAVKLALPFLVASPVAVGGLALGYDHWYRQWKQHLYEPEELQRPLEQQDMERSMV